MQHNNNNKQYHFHKLKIEKKKKKTLEDLLFASPGKEEYNNNICADTNASTGESNLLTSHFFKRICPPFAEDRKGFSLKARERVAMERLLKVEEVIHSGEREVINSSSMSRSQTEKVIRKRVSFKIPSEDDMIIFYTSDVESD